VRKKQTYVSFHIEVLPRGKGDFGFASISGLYYTKEEDEQLANEIIAQIKRHVDNVKMAYMVIDDEWEDD